MRLRVAVAVVVFFLPLKRTNEWRRACFITRPPRFYIGSIKTNHSPTIPALTGLLSLLHCAALITDGNSTNPSE